MLRSATSQSRTRDRRSCAVLCAVIVLLASSALHAQKKSREEKAQKMLDQAEKYASQGKYEGAVSKYRNVARLYPETVAGKIGRRRAQPNAFLGWTYMLQHGPSENRVDVVIFGDGWRLHKQDSFDRLVKTVPDVFEQQRVFREYYRFHNFVRANVVSREDGVGGYGRTYDTAFHGRASGGSSGQVSVNRAAVRAMLNELPSHDGVAAVFVKAGSHGTGGGGVAAVGGRPEDVLIHEWGHAFAGLGDEYSNDVGFGGGPVGRRPNLCGNPDPKQVPWKHWLEAKVRGVGVFEGAGGRAKGAFKPTVKGCLMDTGSEFCVVCRETLVLRVYSMVDPIDRAEPLAHPLELPARPREDDPKPLVLGSGALEFEIQVLRPRSHPITADWWVLPASQVPPPPTPNRLFGESDRRRRGVLKVIEAEPLASTRPNSKGMHKFKLRADDFEAGRYRVLVRARDSTKWSGERTPWVLKDDHDLLRSERGWWVEILPEE